MVDVSRKTARGFTIVELLIVVVIIAILAAITVVAYNGITQRATNTSIITAARNSLALVKGYIAMNEQYPATSSRCITTDPACIYAGNPISTAPDFTSKLQTIGTLPKSAPIASPKYQGIFFSYAPTRNFNSQPMPAQLYYFLKGQKQDCGISGVSNSGGYDTEPSPNKYTSFNVTEDITICAITIIGPAA